MHGKGPDNSLFPTSHFAFPSRPILGPMRNKGYFFHFVPYLATSRCKTRPLINTPLPPATYSNIPLPPTGLKEPYPCYVLFKAHLGLKSRDCALHGKGPDNSLFPTSHFAFPSRPILGPMRVKEWGTFFTSFRIAPPPSYLQQHTACHNRP